MSDQASGAGDRMSLPSIAPPAVIAVMNDQEFDQYWTALGTVVRVVSKNTHPASPAAARSSLPKTEIKHRSPNRTALVTTHRSARHRDRFHPMTCRDAGASTAARSLSTS